MQQLRAHLDHLRALSGSARLTRVARVMNQEGCPERELPDGSWTRQIIDTLVGRFMAIEDCRQD